MKITILVSNLEYNENLQNIINLVNCMCDKYNMEIVSTYKSSSILFSVDSKVTIRHLINSKVNKLKERQIIKNYIKNSDSKIMISTNDIYHLYLGKYGNNIIKIGYYYSKKIKYVNKLDYFILPSNKEKSYYESKVKCRCIYIPSMLQFIPTKKSLLDNQNLISIGKIENQYLELIDVFKMVHDIYSNVKLTIISNEQVNKLKDKINKYNLNQNIMLYSYKGIEDIEKQLLNSSIYISINDSFFLLKASSYRIPSISFENSISEIIKDNWDGYVVKEQNKEQMAKRIISLLTNNGRRVIMGDNAYKKSFNYLENNIKKMWIDLFEGGIK